MKIPSYNCRGLAGPLKKPAFRRIISLECPDIILLKETLGEGLLDLLVSAPLDSGYNLRSSAKKCAKKGVGGFGKGKSSVARGRGRISFLAKAQDRAMRDVHDGRKISIDRALRASKSLKPGV